MGVNNRGSVHPFWTGHAAGALTGFETAYISILDPNSTNDDDNFDIILNSGTVEPTELWQGYAQLAVFRQTLNAEIPAGAITQVRSVRFTVPLNGPTTPIRKGLIVRVLECKHDPDATQYQYTVTSGLNSGLAFKRTIEAEADMGVILSQPAPFIAPTPESPPPSGRWGPV